MAEEPRESSDPSLPTGIVTFLFTDVEGSTRLWAADPDAMSASLRLHDDILRDAIESRGGYVFTTAGDSFAAAFDRASSAVEAATAAQAALAQGDWGAGPALLVRIGIHLGEAEERGGDYFGPTVNTTARVESAGHGGQVITTGTAMNAAGVTGHDLGLHHLRDVAEPLQLFQLGDGDFPALRTTTQGQLSIPSPRTSLVGRDRAVIDIRAFVAQHRLVTLTGVGGCGKTRLAIEVAAREAPSHPDGTWFVDLAAIADDEAVSGAVAAALDLVTNALSPTTDQIATYLAPRNALLVIDNCEHLLDEVADLLDVLLARSPGLRILATSREALELEGEHSWRVPSLELGLDSPATRLFVERAATADDNFDPDHDTAVVVAEICERLDGIPLAIELAAARIRTMSSAEIRDRLDDRFRLLSGGRRRARQRQQTLEATVQWSYELLTTEEQSAIARLAVFQGGFELSDVAAIVDVTPYEAVDLIDALVAKSLVDVTRNAHDHVRHRLLETIRLFALQRLIDAGDAEKTRDRHLDHFVDDPVVKEPLRSGEWAGAVRIQREVENLRAAARWALERDRPGSAALLAAALVDQLMLRGESALLLSWLEGHQDLSQADRVRCLAWAGHVRGESFDFSGGLERTAAAIREADSGPLDFLVLALCFEAKIRIVRGERELASDLLDEALVVAPHTPAAVETTFWAHLWRSSWFAVGGAFAESAASAEAALALASEGFAARQVARDFRDFARCFTGQELAPRAKNDPRRGELKFAVEHVSEIVTVLVDAREIGPDLAATGLAAMAGESVARRPDIIGDWLGAFAYFAAMRGDTERARHIMENSLALTMPGIRPAVSGLLRTAGESELHVSRDHLAGLDALVTRAIIEQPGLLAEELERWG